MSERYELLKWDSETFGFGVAKLLPPQPELTAILAELRGRGVRLVYWVTDPEDEASQAAARALGGRLVDRKVTYEKPLAEGESYALPKGVIVASYPPAAPSPEMLALAVQSGEHSRFRVDPDFPREHFVALYESWMTNSTLRRAADDVLVVRDGSAVVGFVTVEREEDRGVMGLMAVDRKMRGKGLGKSLTLSAFAWSRARGCAAVRLVTQGDNAVACRLYERIGFRPIKVVHIHHIWL